MTVILDEAHRPYMINALFLSLHHFFIPFLQCYLIFVMITAL